MADTGANGTVLGDNVSKPWKTDRSIDMSGIDNHTVNDIPIVHGACVCESDVGNTIIHIPEGADMRGPTAKTILSVTQMEEFGCEVVTTLAEYNHGIHPHIRTPDGYVFPLKYKDGLPYLDIRPVLDGEWEELPHTYLTRDAPWDPGRVNRKIDPNWKSTIPSIKKEKVHPDQAYDEHGNFKDIDRGEPPPDEDDGNDGDSEAETKQYSVNRHMIFEHVTHMIQDELCDTDEESDPGEEDATIHFRHNDDDEYRWNPTWKVNKTKWSRFDVTGRRQRPSRNLKRMNYKESELAKSKESQSTSESPTSTCAGKRRGETGKKSEEASSK